LVEVIKEGKGRLIMAGNLYIIAFVEDQQSEYYLHFSFDFKLYC